MKSPCERCASSIINCNCTKYDIFDLCQTLDEMNVDDFRKDFKHIECNIRGEKSSYNNNWYRSKSGHEVLEIGDDDNTLDYYTIDRENIAYAYITEGIIHLIHN